MKQVIVVRTDLGMSRGKIAVQVSHASVSAFLKAGEECRRAWLSEGQKKVVLRVGSEAELVDLFHKVRRKLPAVLIRDAGLTQLPPGVCTALGIGPVRDEEVDKYVNHLKLL